MVRKKIVVALKVRIENLHDQTQLIVHIKQRQFVSIDFIYWVEEAIHGSYVNHHWCELAESNIDYTVIHADDIFLIWIKVMQLN